MQAIYPYMQVRVPVYAVVPSVRAPVLRAVPCATQAGRASALVTFNRGIDGVSAARAEAVEVNRLCILNIGRYSYTSVPSMPSWLRKGSR